MKKLLFLLCLAGCNSPKPGVWRFTIPTAHAVDVAAQNCQSPTENFILFKPLAAKSVPTTALSARRSITICNDPRNALLVQTDGGNFVNAGAGPFFKCLSDGGTPTSGDSPGLILGPGDCAGYALNSNQIVNCLNDTIDAGMQTVECR